MVKSVAFEAMITYSKLGRYGRTGNMLFELAAMIGIAKHTGFELKLTPDVQMFLPYLKLDLPYYTEAEIAGQQHFYETQLEPGQFDAAVFDQPDGTDFKGYYQHASYFNHAEEEVRWQFRFQDEIIHACDRIIAPFAQQGKRCVGMHVRRTDYLDYKDIFYICEEDYYQKAMSLFDPKTHAILVFSDDMDWCQKHLQGENIFCCRGGKIFEDLCLMSRCDHLIISNSTFSWWPAWLARNPHKQVILPKRWYVNDYQHPEGLYLKGWQAI